MKNLLLTAMLFLVALSVSAQSPIVGQSYKTTVRLSVQPYNIYTTSTDTTTKTKTNNGVISQGKIYEVMPNVKFTIISIINNQYVIQFGRFDDSSSLNAKSAAYFAKVATERDKAVSDSTKKTLSAKAIHNKQSIEIEAFKKSGLKITDTTHAFIGKWANYKEFTISANDLSTKCVLYYTTKADFTFGALTLPLKIRFGDGGSRYSSFEENLNLGLTAGMKFQLQGTKEQYINVVGLIGVSSVTIDSLSVKDKTLYNSANPTSKAVSFGAGVVYQNSSFQIGILSGIDHISGLLGRSWRYQDRVWIGVGIGLALYNDTAAKSTSEVNNSGN